MCAAGEAGGGEGEGGLWRLPSLRCNLRLRPRLQLFGNKLQNDGRSERVLAIVLAHGRRHTELGRNALAPVLAPAAPKRVEWGRCWCSAATAWFGRRCSTATACWTRRWPEPRRRQSLVQAMVRASAVQSLVLVMARASAAQSLVPAMVQALAVQSLVRVLAQAWALELVLGCLEYTGCTCLRHPAQPARRNPAQPLRSSRRSSSNSGSMCSLFHPLGPRQLSHGRSKANCVCSRIQPRQSPCYRLATRADASQRDSCP